jgi:hypothetical protein
MKQTAVEWLVEKIQQANPTFKFDALIREAKAMEKEEIVKAYNQSWHLRDKPYETAEKYYKETFKSE